MQNIITPDHTWEDGYFSNVGRIQQQPEYSPKYSPEYIEVDPNIEYLLVSHNAINGTYGWFIAEYNDNFEFQKRLSSTSLPYGLLKFENPYIRVSFRTHGKGDIKLIPVIDEDKIIVE